MEKKKGINKKLVAIAIALIIVVAGVGIYFALPELTQPATKETIKIGVIAPLSAGATAAGSYVRDASIAAVNEINAHGGVLGRQLELFIGDDAGVVETGAAAARRLIVENEVVAMHGGIHSSVMMSVTDICESYGVPIILCYSTASALTEKHLLTTFRLGPPLEMKHMHLAQWIASMGWTKVVVVSEDTDYGVESYELTKQYGEPLGLVVEQVMYDHTQSEITPVLKLAKEMNPDIWLLACTGKLQDGVGQIQANEVGLFPQVPAYYCSDDPARVAWWPTTGQLGVNVFYNAYFKQGMALTSFGNHTAEVLKANSVEIVGQSIFAWDEVYLIKDAIERCGEAWFTKDLTTKRMEIVTALEDTTFLGSIGIITFPRAEGALWHNFNPPILVCETTALNQTTADNVIVWPTNLKTGSATMPPGQEWW